ncbi:nuclease A inhibitor family protein [Phormidesmis priestleyi]
MKNDLSEVLNQLKEASHGLLWISESEEPFEVFVWENEAQEDLNDRTLLSHLDRANTSVETQDFDLFFATATQIQDWQNEEERAIVHQYQQLAVALKQHLRDLKVYRIGEVNISVYILGKTEAGHIAGLVTQAVET